MTEDQRYGGKNYVAKELKGQKKQEQWINKLQDLVTNSKFSKDISGYLTRILNYDNIPRKKPKFINFVKASIVKDERVAEKLWTIIEQALKPVNDNLENKSTNAKQVNKSSNDKVNDELTNGKNERTADLTNGDQNDDLKRKNEVDDPQLKKVKKHDLNENSADQDESINKVIENLIERSKESETSINPTKLTKKVLKRKENREMKLKKFKKLIRRLGPYTEFKDLSINEFYDKFIGKLSEKDCFLIDKEMIAYKVQE